MTTLYVPVFHYITRSINHEIHGDAVALLLAVHIQFY